MQPCHSELSQVRAAPVARLTLWAPDSWGYSVLAAQCAVVLGAHEDVSGTRAVPSGAWIGVITLGPAFWGAPQSQAKWLWQLHSTTTSFASGRLLPPPRLLFTSRACRIEVGARPCMSWFAPGLSPCLSRLCPGAINSHTIWAGIYSLELISSVDVPTIS